MHIRYKLYVVLMMFGGSVEAAITHTTNYK